MKALLAGSLLVLSSLAAGVQAKSAVAAPQAVAVWNPAYYVYQYLGGSFGPAQCSFTASSYGYPAYYYGYGYVGGVLVYNACFGVTEIGGGVTPVPPPPRPPQAEVECSARNIRGQVFSALGFSQDAAQLSALQACQAQSLRCEAIGCQVL